MKTSQATGAPIALRGPAGDGATWVALLPHSLEAQHGDATELRSEATLQELMHEHPEVIPVRDFWRSHDDHQIISLGREIPVGLDEGKRGFIDNLYLTKSGRLVVVEAKLFRNPEARRKVVAQILDYAAALATMGIDELETALQKSKDPALRADQDLASLYEEAFGGGSPTLGTQFHDVFVSNLRHGEFLLLIVGDGIRESLTQLSELVSRHPRLQYKLGLVAMREFRDPNTQQVILVVPQVLGESRVVARSTVRIEQDVNGGVNVTATPAQLVGVEDDDRVLTFEEFLSSLSASEAAAGFARRMFARVEENPRLSVRYTRTYWDVQCGDIPLWRNTTSRGGSLSANGALGVIKRLRGPAVAEQYARGLAGLAVQASADDDGTRLDQFIEYDELATQEERFWETIDRFIDLI